jgi:calcium-dependent protein kinase
MQQAAIMFIVSQ